jgi:glycosyltransferase involved in cell wall biosynthesis
MSWHIITGEYPPAIGGVSSYTQLVAHGLAAAGDTVHVWCPANDDSNSEVNGVTVHRALGQMTSDDLRDVDRQLDAFSGPLRLLVQWVPHAFGYRSLNLGFCFWLARRARRGDHVEIMVHEPYLAFGEGGVRWNAAALVQRLMTVVLARAARRIWIAIPAWERRWRPYFLGREVPVAWLPIPSTLPAADGNEMVRLRERFGSSDKLVIGYLGSYGDDARAALSDVLPEVLRRLPQATVILLGRHSGDLAQRLTAANPTMGSRISGSGTLNPPELAAYVAACDILIQPYPDGISTRRTSAMAGLALGVPILSTAGHLTEPIWAERRAVALTPVGDHGALAADALQLLADERERRDLGARGRELYVERFALDHTITALRSAAKVPCASPS